MSAPATPVSVEPADISDARERIATHVRVTPYRPESQDRVVILLCGANADPSTVV